MEEIDLSILEKVPEPNMNAILEIQPLAPLSMVSEMPGSYYKTLKIPNKKMLCGLFENLLGWHIDLADRKKISNDVKSLREKLIKKQKKGKIDADKKIIPYKNYTKGSTYLPLLMDYFVILNGQPVISKAVFYDDLWSKSYRRADSAKIHMGGSNDLDYEVLANIHGLKNNVDKIAKQVDKEKDKEIKKSLVAQKKEKEKQVEKFFKDHIGSFPLFYSTPTNREYIDFDGRYKFEIKFDRILLKMVRGKINENNLCYLGTSEGWINLNFIVL